MRTNLINHEDFHIIKLGLKHLKTIYDKKNQIINLIIGHKKKEKIF